MTPSSPATPSSFPLKRKRKPLTSAFELRAEGGIIKSTWDRTPTSFAGRFVFAVMRLTRGGAIEKSMSFRTLPATPEIIAGAVAENLGKRVDYRTVEADGAALAATFIAEMMV